MHIRRTHGAWAAVAAVALAAWPAPSGAGDDRNDDGADDTVDLARAAIAVLEAHCASCHGGPAHGGDADRGGFDTVLDPRRLVADGHVVPFAPDESVLLARVIAGEMPPADAPSRPDASEAAALRAWIEAGAPVPAPDGPDPAGRAFVTDADRDRWIAADLDAAPERARRFYRYVGVVHLYNAGVSDDELELARQGIAKLVNSLSWKRRIHTPTTIDEAGTVLRVDLRELGWTRALWEDIVAVDPYALVRDDEAARATYAATGTFAPYVRGDWLAAAASRPPLYHTILDIPEDTADLQRRLGVDLGGDDAMRAGFNGSGVSQHNRVIERRDASGGGYYWHSFDFASSTGRRNIFEHPVAFDHDGSEIIFSLPNGLQGYMLADATGRRLDRAPTAIVSDPSRGDRAVENGISCMGCHALGLIRKDDQVRAHIEANRDAFRAATVDEALAVYREPAEMARVLAGDRRRFEAALAGAGVTADVEPINFLALAFEAELDGATVAAELGMEPAALAARLERSASLRRTLGAALVDGGTIERAVFVASVVDAARVLDLGTPFADITDADRVELSCASGTARACYRAGMALYEGDGVDRDDTRALRMFVEACKGELAVGCTAAGLLYTAGRGAAADDGRAARYFARACDLGHARGCFRVGEQYVRGRGVTRRLEYAAAFLELGCAGGWGASCRLLGDLTYYGRGVTRDHLVALGLYDRGCDAGSPRACAHAGYMYYEGAGVAENRAAAARYHERACDGDIGASCRRLAIQYRWGQGVEPDWIVSERLFRRACDLGVERACLYL